MSEPLVLTLPLPPNMANSRMHWRVKDKQRKAYLRACDLLHLARRLPEVPAEPWPRAVVRATLVMPSAMDDDNAVSRCKWAIDWIVRAGYVRDDRRTVLRWGAFPAQAITRKRPPALVLELHPEGAAATGGAPPAPDPR